MSKSSASFALDARRPGGGGSTLGKQPIYEVMRADFEPGSITVIVRPTGGSEPMPTVETADSPFYKQAPGAGGFQ